jgi:hypothetical protein
MGKIDEHWCNSCKRSLDKGKDKYVEFELVNDPSITKDKKKPKKSKGIICQQCIDKDPQLKVALELMVKAGNPNFNINIACLSTGECENYEQSKKSGINCPHIAVLGDEVYCKRSHPGVVHLPQEKAEVERLNRDLLSQYLRKLVKNPRLKELVDVSSFEKLLKNVYIPPSSVVEEQHLNLPQQP